MNVDEMLKQILEKLNNIEKDQKETKQDMTEIIQSLARVELTVNEIEKTVSGSQKDVIALLERTATKESITRLDTKIDLINNKLFQAETDLAMLKIAK